MQVDQHVKGVSHQMAVDSITAGVLTVVGDSIVKTAVKTAVKSLVKQIIARVTTAIATSAATTLTSSGGVTMTAASAGGSVGTTIKRGVGTLVCASAGLVVGLAADWWMKKTFKQKLTSECEQLLSQVRDEIVGSPESPGLKQAFVDAIATLIGKYLGDFSKRISPITRLKPGGSGCPTWATEGGAPIAFRSRASHACRAKSPFDSLDG